MPPMVLDFYSSRGCPDRGASCADPYPFNRRWHGLKSGRMLADVFEVLTIYVLYPIAP